MLLRSIILIENLHFFGAETWLFHAISLPEKFVKFSVSDSRIRSATLNQNKEIFTVQLLTRV